MQGGFAGLHGITDEQHIICSSGRANKVDDDMAPSSACSIEFDGRVYEVFIAFCGIDHALSHTLLCSEWGTELFVNSHFELGVFEQANMGMPVLNRCVDEHPDGQCTYIVFANAVEICGLLYMFSICQTHECIW